MPVEKNYAEWGEQFVSDLIYTVDLEGDVVNIIGAGSLTRDMLVRIATLPPNGFIRSAREQV